MSLLQIDFYRRRLAKPWYPSSQSQLTMSGISAALIVQRAHFQSYDRRAGTQEQKKGGTSVWARCRRSGLNLERHMGSYSRGDLTLDQPTNWSWTRWSNRRCKMGYCPETILVSKRVHRCKGYWELTSQHFGIKKETRWGEANQIYRKLQMKQES